MLVKPYAQSIPPWLCLPDVHPPVSIELISPVLRFKKDNHLREYVKGVWDRIAAVYTVETSFYYGTHVDVSTNNGYTSEQVKAIAYAALDLESAINALALADRLKNEYCEGFFASNKGFKGKKVERAIVGVGEVDESHQTMVVELQNLGTDRYYVWNFSNL